MCNLNIATMCFCTFTTRNRKLNDTKIIYIVAKAFQGMAAQINIVAYCPDSGAAFSLPFKFYCGNFQRTGSADSEESYSFCCY